MDKIPFTSSGLEIIKLELNNLKKNTFKKFKIPLEQAQIEAIKIIDEKAFWVTSEDEGIGSPFMYKIEVK